MDDEFDNQNEEQPPSDGDGSDTGPVDIINAQQGFYESFKIEIADKHSHGYVEVLNQEVLKDVIKETLTLYCNLSVNELDSFAKILWEQKKFTGTEHVKMLQLFVICVHDSNGALSYPPDIKSMKFTIHPIYRIPKCFKQNATNQGGCCALFIDEFGRVYKSWDNFKQKNKFKNCLMVAPKDGFYSATVADKVNLDIFFQKDGFLKYVDTGSTVGSVASAVVVGVGLIPAVTLAPAVATGAVVAGVACGVYAGVRSIFTLTDRKKHDQSIGLGNKESRAAYFNIAGGALCAGSAVGAQLAKTAALNRQTIPIVARKAVRYVGLGSVSIQALGCADELITIINDLRINKPISTVYLAQFSAQLFFLAFSIKNFQLTEKLTEVSGTRNPKSIRKILRQHNSGGSFKYFVTGSDFLDKNISGLVNPTMLRVIHESCLNVAEKVKNSCEQKFGLLIRERTRKFHFNIHDEVGKFELRSVILNLLKFMNFPSLDILLDFTKRVHAKLSDTTMKCDAFHFYLKKVYVVICNFDANGRINTDEFFSKKLTDEGLNHLADDIIAEMHQTGNELVKQFDEKFQSEYASLLNLGRKIYLVIQFHCEKFVNELKKFPSAVEASVDLFYDAIEYVLKRLTIEAATLFFGLVKDILNECVLEIPMHEAIKPIFQKLVKKFNGNLTLLEREINSYLSDRSKRNEFGKSFFDELMIPGRALKLKNCFVCGGQGFV